MVISEQVLSYVLRSYITGAVILSTLIKGASMGKNEPIDFIITWVDGNDPNWQAEKEKYRGTGGDKRANRYRDWDTLRFWFRGVERFAPWVNRVYFVTCGHLPAWLDTSNPKLQIVNHKDYIPQEYLPTFSSRPIDMNFHHIGELSEHFVYFNDDMFLIRPVERNDFFKNGLPCDAAIQDVVPPIGKGENGEKLTGDALYTAVFYNTAVINRNFDKKSVIAANRGKWFSKNYGKLVFKNIILNSWNYFTGFKTVHLPYSYLKSSYREVWEKEPEVLAEACRHKFRTSTDVNHFIFSYWQFAKGTFSPRDLSIGKLMSLSNDEKRNTRIYETIKTQRLKMICINDQFSGSNFEEVNQNLVDSFMSILPDKCSFEL